FHEQGVPAERPLPHFAAECTPPLADSFAYFRDALMFWQGATDAQTAAVVQAFGHALETAGISPILFFLGQRLTSASLRGGPARRRGRGCWRRPTAPTARRMA